jgi:glycosyltransferase involved in cell wall biosynthesis
MSNDHRQICWITPDYFLNVDAPIVPKLSRYYSIDWVLISTLDSKRTKDGLLRGDFRPREYQLQYRQRDPRIIGQYTSLISSIRKAGHDVLYTSFHGLPYFFPVLSSMMDPDRVIYGIHNVHTPKGASHERWMRLYHRYAFRVLKRFHVFSRNQLRVISDMLPTKRLYYAPFAPDDYGESTARPPVDRIRFTSFGYIRQYKRLDLLIGAFKRLYDEGLRDIELLIAGGCDTWDRYKALIDNHPGIHARIGVVPNEDIPDLISSSHYLVLPYQDGAQSGVLPMAYRYGTPVITSDIDAFRDAVVDGITGFRFRSLSEESLCQTMRDVVLRHEEVYAGLKRNIRTYVAKEYSSESIFAKYREFIDDTLQPDKRRDVSPLEDIFC